MDNASEALPVATEQVAAPPAGFWIRAGAYMIDGLLLGVAGVIASFFLPGFLGRLFRLALGAFYFTWMPVAYNGQTLGKMAAGVAVMRTDGSPLTYGRMFGRWLGYILSTIVAGLGFLCAAFTANKRALHDFIVGTRVVYVEEVPGWRKAMVVCMGALFPLILFPLIMVLGVLAARSIPKFAQLVVKSEEGATKGRLGSLRAGLALHYGDTNGRYPADPGSLVPKYVQSIGSPKIRNHPGASGIELYGAEVCSGSKEYGQEIIGAKLRDTGKWGYVADPKAVCFGSLFVDCTHQDTKGKDWYTY